jgi:glycosyltransferase involved in cell wall biosynthesis
MTKPTVSIGLPVFNGEKYLGKAISSLLGQTYWDVALTVSDNASTDRTGEIALEFSRRDSRVRYTRNETNQGLLANVNKVIDDARGEYFMLGSDDDLWEPTYVEELLGQFTNKGSELGLIYPSYDWIDETDKFVRAGKTEMFVSNTSPMAPWFSYGENQHWLHSVLLHYFWRNPFLVYGLFRTTALRAAAPFKYTFGSAAHSDNLFLLRFLSRFRAERYSRVLFHYRHRVRDTANLAYRDPESPPANLSKAPTSFQLERAYVSEGLHAVISARGSRAVGLATTPMLVGLSAVLAMRRGLQRYTTGQEAGF